MFLLSFKCKEHAKSLTNVEDMHIHGPGVFIVISSAVAPKQEDPVTRHYGCMVHPPWATI
jgi:hypothetical protein